MYNQPFCIVDNEVYACIGNSFIYHLSNNKVDRVFLTQWDAEDFLTSSIIGMVRTDDGYLFANDSKDFIITDNEFCVRGNIVLPDGYSSGPVSRIWHKSYSVLRKGDLGSSLGVIDKNNNVSVVDEKPFSRIHPVLLQAWPVPFNLSGNLAIVNDIVNTMFVFDPIFRLSFSLQLPESSVCGPCGSDKVVLICSSGVGAKVKVIESSGEVNDVLFINDQINQPLGVCMHNTDIYIVDTDWRIMWTDTNRDNTRVLI